MKIALCGTVSVGKTTLVKELEKNPMFKNYKFFTERSKYLRDLGIPLNTESTLKGQTIFLAERCSELLHDNMISDRSIIDVMAFTMASQEIDCLDKEDFYNHAKNFISDYDIIFYISPEGIPIEENGVRATNEKYRNLINDYIIKIIGENIHRFKNIDTIKGGTIEERVDFIIKKITNSNL